MLFVGVPSSTTKNQQQKTLPPDIIAVLVFSAIMITISTILLGMSLCLYRMYRAQRKFSSSLGLRSHHSSHNRNVKTLVSTGIQYDSEDIRRQSSCQNYSYLLSVGYSDAFETFRHETAEKIPIITQEENKTREQLQEGHPWESAKLRTQNDTHNKNTWDERGKSATGNRDERGKSATGYNNEPKHNKSRRRKKTKTSAPQRDKGIKPSHEVKDIRRQKESTPTDSDKKAVTGSELGTSDLAYPTEQVNQISQFQNRKRTSRPYGSGQYIKKSGGRLRDESEYTSEETQGGIKTTISSHPAAAGRSSPGMQQLVGSYALFKGEPCGYRRRSHNSKTRWSRSYHDS